MLKVVEDVPKVVEVVVDVVPKVVKVVVDVVPKVVKVVVDVVPKVLGGCVEGSGGCSEGGCRLLAFDPQGSLGITCENGMAGVVRENGTDTDTADAMLTCPRAKHPVAFVTRERRVIFECRQQPA